MDLVGFQKRVFVVLRAPPRVENVNRLRKHDVTKSVTVLELEIESSCEQHTLVVARANELFSSLLSRDVALCHETSAVFGSLPSALCTHCSFFKTTAGLHRTCAEIAFGIALTHVCRTRHALWNVCYLL